MSVELHDIYIASLEEGTWTPPKSDRNPNPTPLVSVDAKLRFGGKNGHEIRLRTAGAKAEKLAKYTEGEVIKMGFKFEILAV